MRCRETCTLIRKERRRRPSIGFKADGACTYTFNSRFLTPCFPPFVPTLQNLQTLGPPQDDKFKVAFYYALRDTLVAPTLDEATKIAYDGKRARYRVVTLKGQLIDTSGTMSGGGSKVRLPQHKSKKPNKRSSPSIQHLTYVCL